MISGSRVPKLIRKCGPKKLYYSEVSKNLLIISRSKGREVP